MSRVLSDLKDRIVELWLEGHPRDFIAKRLRLSGDTVSRQINQFRGSLTGSAAERFENLRLLSADLRKSHKSLAEALRVTRLCNKLEDIRVNVENVTHFVVRARYKLHSRGW